MSIKNFVRPATFARKDPHPEIPFSDEAPVDMHLGWLLFWCGVGAVGWLAVLAVVTM